MVIRVANLRRFVAILQHYLQEFGVGWSDMALLAVDVDFWQGCPGSLSLHSLSFNRLECDF